MKIGVVTNFDTKNYGSLLQAYALQKKIEEIGGKPFVLQRKNNNKRSVTQRMKKLLFRSGNNYSLREKLAIKRAKKEYYVKNKKLKKFIDDNISVRNCTDDSARLVIGDVDAMIAGSDQIWSSTAGTLSKFTTLQFVPDRIKRYSYAASLGMSELNDESRNILHDGLSRFSEVTVRESSALNIIREVTNVPSSVVVDPTFLYDGEYWKAIANSPKLDEPYIFVYMLRPEPITLNAAKALSKRTGYKICLCSNRIVKDKGIINITDAGIEDFLGYINNAAYVITNSFHGTAFSVQFKKKFVSVAISGSGMRVADFLDMIGASDRIIKSADQVSIIDQALDWDLISNVIDRERYKSIEYLKQISKSISEKAAETQTPILFRDETECCACSACANICPQNAIKMVPNKYGYMFPHIDSTLCVGCKMCKNVCNYQNGYVKGKVQEAYGAVAISEDVRMNSSSGGVFSAIAESILSQGGVVYGCSMELVDNKLIPMHIEVSNSSDLYKLKKSKYAQSNIDYIYRKVKNALISGKTVLFSGTGCQIAGLKGYLGNKYYDNLFTIDIICHGVPSAAILQDYIAFVEKQKRISVNAVDFRDKAYGWGVKGTITGKKGNEEKKIYFDNYTSSYYNLYLKAAFFRDNCYSCPYANTERPGDITLGDFWGLEKQHPEWLNGDNKWIKSQGVSCILVNGDQGKRLLELFGQRIEKKECSLDEITAKNLMLLRPSKVFSEREKVLDIYSSEGYEALDRWFKRKYGLKNVIYGKWDSIPLATRNRIKKFLRK